MEAQIETPVGYWMPDRTSELINEAGGCFTNGNYTGCVLSLAAGVEHGLRTLLTLDGRTKLDKLIMIGVDAGLIETYQAEFLRSLKDYRNNSTHSNITDYCTKT